MLKKIELIGGKEALVVGGLGEYSLRDTLECGQCFRYEKIKSSENGCDEYIVTLKNKIVKVGQRRPGELIFFGTEEIDDEIRRFFSLDVDLEHIKADVIAHTDSEWLKSAAECGCGIAILAQDPWETLVSFIISQNNNIPRIRKIIKQICAEYGENLAATGTNASCPLSLCNGAPSDEHCRRCGICYSFPPQPIYLKDRRGFFPPAPASATDIYLMRRKR